MVFGVKNIVEKGGEGKKNKQQNGRKGEGKTIWM